MRENSMSQDEILGLILKATAIYLFVLAVIALPNAVGGLFGIVLFSPATLSVLSGDGSAGDNLIAPHFATAVTEVLRFAFFILVGRNLFAGGSWIRRIFGAKVIAASQSEE